MEDEGLAKPEELRELYEVTKLISWRSRRVPGTPDTAPEEMLDTPLTCSTPITTPGLLIGSHLCQSGKWDARKHMAFGVVVLARLRRCYHLGMCRRSPKTDRVLNNLVTSRTATTS